MTEKVGATQVETTRLKVLGPSYFVGPAHFESTIDFASILGVARVFNPMDYGATGVYTDDSTAGVQAAIEAAEAVPGGIVGIPAGTYKLTSALRIKKTVTIIGFGGNVAGADSDYTTDAGTANLVTQGVILWQSTNNQNGLLIRQDPTATYKIHVRIENILFVGQITSAGVGPGGTTGDGIIVDPQDIGQGCKCIFRNVGVSYFRGYGLKLAEGYYGSTFDTIDTNGCGLTGFYAIGNSQGEYVVTNLRSFGNGANGAVESDQAGMYIGSGGGILLSRISCTTNYRVQAMFEGCNFIMQDFWAESFIANHAADRCLIFKNSSPRVYAVGLTPQSGFLGKMIDCRGATNGVVSGIRFFSTSDASGHHIFEDGSSGSNIFQVSSLNGTLYTSLSTDSIYENGNSPTKLILTNLAASRSLKIVPTTPATATRTVTIPDPGADANFVLSEATATINGIKTFATQLIGKGTSTNDDAATGYIGESVRSAITGNTNFPASGAWGDLTSASLTAGDWLISGVIWAAAAGAAVSYWEMGISLTSGNSTTGLILGDNYFSNIPPTSAYDSTVPIPGYRLSLSGTTTIYLKYSASYITATPVARGRISAVRIR